MQIRYESTAGIANVGIRILNADKTEYAALTTTGVTEVSPGGYGVTVADSVLAGRTVEWYEGATYSVSESFPSSIADTASIKAKTDALPADPADQSAVEAVVAAAVAPLAQQSTAAAIKAKTDALPTDPADQSAVEVAIANAVAPLATASVAQSILANITMVLRWFTNRRTVSDSEQVLYDDDAITPLYRQDLTDDGQVAERGSAT